MGQRTQMIVRVNNEHTNIATTSIFHYQFGFAKVMPTEFMSYILWLRNSSFSAHYSTFLFNATKIDEDFEDTNLEEIDIWDLENDQLQELLEGCDNNNGYMVTEIWLNEYGGYKNSKIGFLSGREDDKVHTHQQWLPLEEYLKPFPTFVPQEFAVMFEQFTKLFDVEVKTK